MGNLFSCFKKIRHVEVDSFTNKNPITHYLQDSSSSYTHADLKKLSNIYPGIYSSICPSYIPVEDVYKISKTKDTLFATVADGHHGSECAHFTISILHDVLGYLLTHMTPVKALESSHLILDEFILNLPFYLNLYEFKNHYNLEMKINALDTPLRMGTTKSHTSKLNPVLNMDMNAMGIALSGATALTLMITTEDKIRKLYVANVGDSSAILIRQHNSSDFSAYKLTKSHTAKSAKEYERLTREHPDEEKTIACINSYGEMRLLGVLIPTRSFGDAILKWDIKQSRRVNKSLDKHTSVYSHNIKRSNVTPHLENSMISPPYVTAKPEIYIRDIENSVKLQDRFAILATDGIWDKISPELAAYLVINAISKRSKEKELIKVQSLKSLPDLFNKDKLHPCLLDTNPATAILRYCLGASDEQVTIELNYTFPHSKQKRDDCTIIVVDLQSQDYFKSNSELFYGDKTEIHSVGHDYQRNVIEKVIDMAHPINAIQHFEKVHSEQSLSPIQGIINNSLTGNNIQQLTKTRSKLDVCMEIPNVDMNRGEYIVNSLFA